MSDKVSVIVPCYNCSKFIDETVQTVLLQSFNNWELILIDDGSKDESLQKINQLALLDSRIKVFTHTNGENKGVSATRNLGIQHSSGEYIALLDSDDLWHESKLQKQVIAFEMNPSVGIVYSQLTTLFEDANNGFPEVCGTGENGINDQTFDKMVKDELWMPNSSVIFKKDIIKKVGLFNEKLKYQVEDHLFFTKATYFYPCYYIKESLGIYRMHSTSYTYNTKWQNSLYEFLYELLKDPSIKPKKIILVELYRRISKDCKKMIIKVIQSLKSK